MTATVCRFTAAKLVTVCTLLLASCGDFTIDRQVLDAGSFKVSKPGCHELAAYRKAITITDVCYGNIIALTSMTEPDVYTIRTRGGDDVPIHRSEFDKYGSVSIRLRSDQQITA